MRRVGNEEGEELEVGAIAEPDERVLGSDRVLPPEHDREAERRVAPDRPLEIRDDDDDVVDAIQHRLSA